MNDLERSVIADLPGEDIALSGNVPFLLDDPASVWLVLEGRVEAFSVGVDRDRQPSGTRRHFLTAEPGDALFGMDLADADVGLLAVGAQGTRVRRVAVAQLRDLPLSSLDDVVGLIDRWVLGLSRGIGQWIVPQPRADLRVEPGVDGSLADGGRVRATEGVAWLRARQADVLFIGMEDVEADALFPITPETFLQSLGDASVTTIDTRAAFADGSGWAALPRLHQALLQCQVFNTRLAAADELNRLRQKTERNRQSRARALGELARVLESGPAEPAPTEIGDPLLASCVLIGTRLSLSIQAPPARAEDAPATDPVGDIAKASRIRMRRVLLRGEWWRHDPGPLLVFLDDGRPAALLPAGAGRLTLHDPTASGPVPADLSVISTIAPLAYTFYRPFPDKALRPVDLLTFALVGTTGELARPLLVGLAGGALSVIPPYFTGLLVDSVIPAAQRAPLVQLALALAVVALSTTAFALVVQMSVVRLEVKMSSAVQAALWDRLLRLPVPFFRRYSAGDLAQRASAVETIRRLVSGAALKSVMTSVFSVFLFVQLFFYSAPLALVATGLVAVSMAVVIGVTLVNLKHERTAMALSGEISGLVLQLLSGVSKLRITGSEGRAFNRWANLFAQQKTVDMKVQTVANGFNAYNSAISIASTMVFFYMVAFLSASAAATGAPPISAGQFIAFITVFGMFLAQMLDLGTTIVSLLEIVPLYERAAPVLTTLPEVDATKADPGVLSGEISVEHVSFRYHEDGPLVLKDVSLTIAPGEFVAFVGPSGSGKSTLLRLLLALDAPESGSIYYDGHALDQLDVERVRRQVGVVLQTGKLRAGSIGQNIIGTGGLTKDDAMRAAVAAGFDEDLRDMPMGLETILQQGGLTLSGGQRQRLMIARAIVNRPRILLLDEATSALDNRTQSVVATSLQQLQATRVVVAHRLSTIIGADRIYVVDGGTIVQVGTYEDLAAQEGLFADLIKRQTA